MSAGSRLAVALLSIAVASACSGKPVPQRGSASEAPVLTVARVKDAVTLDPAQATDGMSLNVTEEIMRGLVAFRPGTFEVEPAIAQSWSVSPDGRTWTFTLKRGLRFSDGTPVDASAVKFNFDRWRLLTDPYHGNFPFTYYATMFGGFPGLIQGVEAASGSVVVFHLARPFAPFLHDLAMPSFAIGSPTAIRDDLEGFEGHPVGWGPYMLERWIKGERIVLRANPRYPVRPYYSTVEILDVPDQAAGLAEMERGAVDVLTDPTPRDAAVLAKTPGVAVYQQPANNCAYLAMNMDRKPFGLLQVRKAVAYAIDVRSIVKMYYPMGAEIANNWTPPGMAGENPAVKAYPYDPARARALLAAAGYRRGFSTQLVYAAIPRPYMPQPGLVAAAIARELARVGIRVKLVPLEWTKFLDTVHNGEHAMALAGWSGDNGDPDNFLYTLLDKDSARRPNALNFSFWRSERYHRLMLEGQETSDPAQRAKIYEEANAMVHDLVPAIPIVHVAAPLAVRASIGGVVPNPTTFIAFEHLYPAG
jgi:peptide/nickel transport system substrate-binding protein